MREVLCYLRAHNELCKQRDYQRLYDECMYYLILHQRLDSNWTENDPEDQQGTIEYFCDLENQRSEETQNKFTQEKIERYLKFRKYRWAEAIVKNLGL